MDKLTEQFEKLNLGGKKKVEPNLYTHVEGEDDINIVKGINYSTYSFPRTPTLNRIWLGLRKILTKVKKDGRQVYTIHVGHDGEDEKVADYQMRTTLSGKLKEGETPKDGARRELMEETGLYARKLINMGFQVVKGRTDHYFIAQIGEHPTDLPALEYDERPDNPKQRVFVLAGPGSSFPVDTGFLCR